jgi:hypothetical protein
VPVFRREVFLEIQAQDQDGRDEAPEALEADSTGP